MFWFWGGLTHLLKLSLFLNLVSKEKCKGVPVEHFSGASIYVGGPTWSISQNFWVFGAVLASKSAPLTQDDL